MEAVIISETPLAQVIDWARKQAWSGFAMSIADSFDKFGKLSDRQEVAIRSMFSKNVARVAGAERVAEQVVANPITEAGMYRKDGVVFRVRKTREGNRFYALRYVPEGADAKARFVYEGGAIRRLSADDRLTLAEAQELGHQWGQCCVCGAELTDPKSVVRGIGPVCAKRV